ncbi:MAG: HlyD family efflux transporter periplasmic adaptor subunit [Lachnospiraceae bacterium]
MNKQKNNKIVKYRNGPVFNIGTVLFGVIFIYMIICLVMYVTTDHITAYEVTAGPLAGNYRYSALALRSETIINADHAGNVSYYVREGSKAGTGTAVCTVNEGSATTSLVPEKVSTGSEAASAMTEGAVWMRIP